MRCQDCGSNDAFVHMTEIVDGDVSSIWLCSSCSSKRQDQAPRPFSDLYKDKKDSENLASFLGDDFVHPQHAKLSSVVSVCPACDYHLSEWRETNLLGCPRCYQAFSAPIASQLDRFHGHAIHLGRNPSLYSDGANTLTTIKRVRVALEKAVAREDFEEAARQRDLLEILKQGKGDQQ